MLCVISLEAHWTNISDVFSLRVTMTEELLGFGVKELLNTGINTNLGIGFYNLNFHWWDFDLCSFKEILWKVKFI